MRLTLTTISGYQRFHQDKHLDEDSTALQALDFRQLGQVGSFNQETRLAGETGRWRWLAGGYAAWQKSDESFAGDVVSGSLAEPLPGIFPRFTTVGGAFEFHKRDLAAFGNVEYRAGEHLTLIGGLRYTNSLQSFYGCQQSGSDPALGETLAYLSAAARRASSVDPVPQSGCIQIDAATLQQAATHDRLAENNVSWRGNVNYKTDGGSLLYANIAKGFKSGSFPSLSVSSSLQFAPVSQDPAGLRGWRQGSDIGRNGAGGSFGLLLRLPQQAGTRPCRRPRVRCGRSLGQHPEITRLRLPGIATGTACKGLDLGVSAVVVDSKVQRFTGYDQNGVLTDFAGSPFPIRPASRWSRTRPTNGLSGLTFAALWAPI
jgi:hypothetical protein